jgi:2-methylcitrate dehydratase PrpD
MTLLQKMIRENHIRADQVEQLRVGTSAQMLNTLIHHHPQTGLEAKFSMEFCMAILLLERRAGLPQFTDAVVNRPDVKAMIERVVFEADESADAGGFREMTSLIEIELVDGSVFRARAEFGKGSPSNPMGDDEVIDKFLACLDWAGIPADVGHEVATQVLDLAAQGSIREVLRPLHGAAARSVA